jgi:prepilin-type processing-associated H-X9-DG protein
VQILPFIEQGNLYRQIDFRQGVYAPANTTVLATQLKMFICASSPWRGRMNYAGSHHDVEAPIDADNHGVLYLNSHVRHDDITDGPAYTILLGEHKGGAGFGWALGTRATLRNTGPPINAREPLTIPTPLWPYPQTPAPPAPGAVEASVQGGLLPMTYVGGFSSHHPGGANFLLCDGSARLIKQSIDQRVLQRLGNRSDGDLIGDDQF